jgi:hypothetical protein
VILSFLIMTVLSVREVRAFGDELQRDPLQHANHCVSLLNCISQDLQEVRLTKQLHRQQQQSKTSPCPQQQQ